MTDGEIRAQLADMLVRCGIERGVLGRIDADNLACTLLPVVKEYGDQRAATEVRHAFSAAANEAVQLGRRGPNAVADWLLDFGQDFAAILRGEAGR